MSNAQRKTEKITIRQFKKTKNNNETAGVVQRSSLEVQTDSKGRFIIINGQRKNIPPGAVVHAKIHKKHKKIVRKKIIPKLNDVKYEVKLGTRTVVTQTQAPFSNFWHRANEVRDFLVFFVNLIFAAYDLISDPNTDLLYKATSFAFGIGEIFVVIIIWVLSLCCIDIMSSKKAQYTENIVMEILLFIAIILTLYGLVVGKDYMIDDSVQIIAMALLIIDIADLVILYGLRLILVRKFANGLNDILQSGDPTFNLSKSEGIRPGIVICAYITIVGNSLVFAVLLFVVALQVHQDNHISQDYTFNTRQLWLILMTLFIPISSLAVFVLVNFHWVMEYSLRVTLLSLDTVQQFCEDEENEEVADVLEANKTTMNHGKRKKQVQSQNDTDTEQIKDDLKKLQESSTKDKFLYATNEWRIMLLLTFWFLLLFTIPLALDINGQHIHSNVVIVTLLAYFIVVLFTNWQAVLVVLAFIPVKIYKISQRNNPKITQVKPLNAEN